MSFVSRLFGFGASNPKIASPIPAAPNIGDAAGEAAAREARARLKRRTGYDDSILASGLGDVGKIATSGRGSAGGAPAAYKRSTLG